MGCGRTDRPSRGRLPEVEIQIPFPRRCIFQFINSILLLFLQYFLKRRLKYGKDLVEEL